MAVAVQSPQRSSEGGLDKILKGLQIASSVYGIKTNMAQLDEYADKKKMRDAELDRMKRNVISGAEEAKYKSDGYAEVPQGTANAVAFQREDGSPLYMAIQKKSPMTDTIAQQRLEFDKQKHSDDLKLKQRELAQGPAAKAQEAKPAQSTTAALAAKAEQSERVFSELSAKGFDRTSYGSGLKSLLPASMQPGELRQLDQAERNFVNSVLRDESGATITDDEIENARQQYFPRVGDTPEVVAQKAESRAAAIAGLKQKSGSAYDSLAAATSPGFRAPKRNTGPSLNPFASETAVAASPDAPAKAPKKGSLVDGYVFQGGDPADKKNWKKK